jgi:hypothetical protein
MCLKFPLPLALWDKFPMLFHLQGTLEGRGSLAFYHDGKGTVSSWKIVFYKIFILYDHLFKSFKGSSCLSAMSQGCGDK